MRLAQGDLEGRWHRISPVDGTVVSHDVTRRVERSRERVLDCIATYGPVCDDDIAFICDLNINTVRSRRLELADAGEIREDGRVPTKTGRSATAWKATDDA